jgi:hypothetical protein
MAFNNNIIRSIVGRRLGLTKLTLRTNGGSAADLLYGPESLRVAG